MAIDKRTIADMLGHYATMLRDAAAGARAQADDMPATRFGATKERHAKLCEAVQDLHEAASAVDEQRNALSEELEADGLRQADTLRRFAGAWPPADPLELFAMWKALLDDIDAEGMADYLDGDPYDSSPLLPHWTEANDALHALDPTDQASARAILLAAKRDEEEAGGSWDWDDELLAVAAAHAGPGWQP